MPDCPAGYVDLSYGECYNWDCADGCATDYTNLYCQCACQPDPSASYYYTPNSQHICSESECEELADAAGWAAGMPNQGLPFADPNWGAGCYHYPDGTSGSNSYYAGTAFYGTGYSVSWPTRSLEMSVLHSHRCA